MKYLYKYRPDDIYTIKTLCDKSLHFSHPYDFNDPFDSKPLCSRDVENEDILAQIKIECPSILKLCEYHLGRIQSQVKRGDIQRIIHNTLNMNYICCFSLNGNNPAMWAHYSLDHHGLCLGFDSTIKSPFLEGTKGEVKYTEKQTKVNWTKVGDADFDSKSFFFEKSKIWEYEQEYRIVKHHKMIEEAPKSYNSFKKDALVAMYFGLKMSDERQEFYKLLCKQCGLEKVKFYKMTMPTDGSYLLIPKEI